MASFVGMQHEMLLLHNWDNNNLLFILFINTTLNRLGFGMLNMGTTISLSMAEYPEAMICIG